MRAGVRDRTSRDGDRGQGRSSEGLGCPPVQQPCCCIRARASPAEGASTGLFQVPLCTLSQPFCIGIIHAGDAYVE